MPVKHRDQGWIGTLAVALALALLPTGPCATAQEGIDIRSRFDSSPGGTLPGNRPGMSIGRGGPFRKDMLPAAHPDRLAPPPVVGDVVPTAPVELKLKDPRKPLGAEHGTTLGGTIEVMRRQNPDIIAAASEVDQAHSDIVTAGLRSNPQFYADMQLVPYSILAPGQVDVNIAYPIDVSGKRRTRIKSAACVLRSVEWKFRDFDRRQVDNIQTLFVDTLASQVTVEFMQKSYQSSVVDRDDAEKELKKVDLRLMPSLNDVSGIPTEGKNLIIVAAVNKVLRFRIFADDGKVDVDTDEKSLTEQARQIKDPREQLKRIKDLREQLKSLWPPHELTWSDEDRVITAVTSIVGPTQVSQKKLDRVRAENGLRDAKRALDDAKSQLRDQLMALGLFLSISDPRSIKLQGWLYDERTYPDPEADPEDARAILEGLTRLAFEHRPDLQSQRWNLCRALADVDAVRASRLDDVSFLLQPYTYSPTLPDRTAWAVGVTIPLPIYNRQQGNLAKAQQIVWQARAQLTSLENTVRAEVAAAYNAVVDTWGDMDRYYTLRSNPREPADLVRQDPTMSNNVRDYLVKLDPIVRKLAQDTNNRNIAAYYRALVEHRKSVLRINTACGCMVCPDSPFEVSGSPLAPTILKTR